MAGEDVGPVGSSPLPPGDAPPSRRPTGPVPPPITTGPRVGRAEVSRWRLLSTYYIPIGVAGGLAVFFLMGWLHYYSIPFIIQHLPDGVQPCITSLEFTTGTFVIGLCFAMGLGMIRAHPPKLGEAATRRPGARGRFSFLWRWPLYGFATGYVQAIRGTPFLVQMFIVYWAIALPYPSFTYLGWDQFYWAGFVALLINTTGYQAEAIRGGIQSVEAGQIEGAKAVGLGRLQTFFRITMPQTLRLITLPLTNEWISNFKTATILSWISVYELFEWSSTTIAVTPYARPIEGFVLLTIFYLTINVTLSRVITHIEKVRRIPGLGTPIPEVSYAKRVLGTDRAGERTGTVGLGAARDS